MHPWGRRRCEQKLRWRRAWGSVSYCCFFAGLAISVSSVGFVRWHHVLTSHMLRVKALRMGEPPLPDAWIALTLANRCNFGPNSHHSNKPESSNPKNPDRTGVCDSRTLLARGGLLKSTQMFSLRDEGRGGTTSQSCCACHQFLRSARRQVQACRSWADADTTFTSPHRTSQTDNKKSSRANKAPRLAMVGDAARAQSTAGDLCVRQRWISLLPVSDYEDRQQTSEQAPLCRLSGIHLRRRHEQMRAAAGKKDSSTSTDCTSGKPAFPANVVPIPTLPHIQPQRRSWRTTDRNVYSQQEVHDNH